MSFLDLTGYYKQFEERLSHIAIPLSRLTQNAIKFECEKKCEVFSKLKNCLMTTPILIIPLDREGFQISCDASLKGLGNV